ncbi:hypothetical protein N9118_01475 [Akkermansiaceae bacterium]|nr:hypothetical protein [Akkermansiaceae bacterium]
MNDFDAWKLASFAGDSDIALKEDIFSSIALDDELINDIVGAHPNVKKAQ